MDEIFFQVEFDLSKTVSTKPKAVLSRRGHHVESVYDVITPPRMDQFWAKFGRRRHNSTQITVIGSKSQREEIQYGGRLFFQTRSSHASRGLR